jgi:hypothetical protein
MSVLRTLAAALLVLSATSACASQPAPPAKPPLVDAETQLTPRRRDKPYDPPRIVAPPPAYGNKIVMAGSPASRL